MISIFERKFSSLISDKKFYEILAGYAWSLGASVISTALAMVTNIIIARIYGAEIMGVMAMINFFLTLSAIFATLGTSTSILRLIPEHVTKYSTASAFRIYCKTQLLVISTSAVLGILVFWRTDLIAGKLLGKPQLSFLFALAAICTVFVSLTSLNTQAVRGLRLIRTLSFMQLLPSLSRLSILICITLFFFNLYNPIYAVFVSFLITALVGSLIMHHEFKNKMLPFDIVKDEPIKNILCISLPMFMTAAMIFVMAQFGVIILGMFRTEAEIGYYFVAVKLAELTTLVLAAANSMAAPKFSELFHAGNMEELFYVARKSAKLIFWSTIPILVILIVLGKPLLGLLFGRAFTAAYGSLVFLVIGQAVNAVAGSTGYFMDMTGNQNVLRNIMFGATILNITLNIVLIPSFGINGAAFASMASLVSWNIVALLFIKVKYGKAICYLPSF